MISPGIHRIPMADYLADPCSEPSLSSSCLNTLMTHSPKHAWWAHPRLGGHGGDNASKADLGTVAHDLLLGGEGKICVIDPEDHASKNGTVPIGWTNKSIREARDEARSNGLTPILKGCELGAKAMAREARAFIAETELKGIFDDGEPEVTLIAQLDGAWLRARPDWFSPGRRTMVHYKTTEASVEPERFARGVVRGMGYATALAFYARVLELVDHEAFDWQHVILAQEQTPPYACSLIGMDPAKQAIELQNVEIGIGIWSRCLRSGKWPAYSTAVHYVGPTAWELAESEMRTS